MKFQKKINNNYINYSNRGMDLEKDINETNKYYEINNIALIYKRPTPIKTTKVSYNKNSKIIKEAYFEKKSTTDYNGIYKGKYIDFEAKETKNKNIFPLSNIKSHQLKHIKNVLNHNGIIFLIIRFTNNFETYLLEGEKLLKHIENKNKSINKEFLKKEGYLIKEKYNPRIDYIKIIDYLYFKGDKNE